MAFIKEEIEDVKIEETFSVKQEETKEQTGTRHPALPSTLPCRYHSPNLPQTWCH
ncbi:zinc finger protein 721-like [Pimephales promelas]|nr:zinc finger protein 721-like [Pimephales promelas]